METATSGSSVISTRSSDGAAVESELTTEAAASYGDWRILAGGHDCKLYTSGFEYDRHSWGHWLKARADYTAELLPVVILNEPAKADKWGNPKSLDRRYVAGLGISPIGFRMMWAENHRVRPYYTVKGGVLAFPIKVLATNASYVNLSLEQDLGLQVDLNQRWGLRLGMFSDFHFSDAFIVPVNPGLDVMNSSIGLTYHLRPKKL